MAWWFLLLSTHVSWANVASLEPIVTLDSLPEDGDLFLQAPRQVAVDEQGRFFVLDVESYAVFVWDKKGQYVQHFGKQGSGPGEFVFNGRRGGARGFMTIQKDKVYIYDPAKRQILTFSTKDYSFQGEVPFQMARSRPEFCQVLSDDKVLVSYRRFSEEGMTRNIGLFDKTGKEISSLQTWADESFKVKPGNSGRRRSFTITAFGPTLVAGYDSKRNQIMIGNSETPQFTVFDAKGKKLKNIDFKLPQRPVSDEDKEEFNEQEFVKNSRGRISTEFPDNKAYYDQILALDDGYLVFNRSPYYRTMQGVWLDLEGKVKARFSLSCGENGDLVTGSGRLFGIMTDDEGEFSLQELRITQKSGKS